MRDEDFEDRLADLMYEGLTTGRIVVPGPVEGTLDWTGGPNRLREEAARAIDAYEAYLERVRNTRLTDR